MQNGAKRGASPSSSSSWFKVLLVEVLCVCVFCRTTKTSSASKKIAKAANGVEGVSFTNDVFNFKDDVEKAKLKKKSFGLLIRSHHGVTLFRIIDLVMANRIW